VLTAVATATVVFVTSYSCCPVTGVHVVGARMFPESVAKNAVPNRASILTLNTVSVERKIESNPWVKGAVVTKNWESGIVTVQVEERRAVLDAEVNGERVIVAADGEKLPGLGGASLGVVTLDEDQLGEVLEFAKTLESNEVGLDSVNEAGPGGIEATVEGRRVVFSGDISEAKARALESIMNENPRAGIFDLRSPQRVVVGKQREEPEG
jgi:cell division septal protein FtsQ